MATKQRIDLDVVVKNSQRIDALERSLGRTSNSCLLYTSDAAHEGLGVDLGGLRIIKKK